MNSIEIWSYIANKWFTPNEMIVMLVLRDPPVEESTSKTMYDLLMAGF